MPRVVVAIVVAGLGCAVLAGGCRTPPPAVVAAPPPVPRDVDGAARSTLERWRQAYELRSLPGLEALYARDVDLVVIREGVALLGWSSVEAMLKDRLVRAPSIRIRLKDIGVVGLGPDVASLVATMTRESSDGATAITENGTLSLILRKIGDTWVIVHEHFSYKRS